MEAFEGNKAETATMLPVINAFKTAHQLTDVTVVADAGMISEANQIALQASGLSFILGTRIPFVPDVVREWRDKHPGQDIPDGHVFTQPWPAATGEKARGIPRATWAGVVCTDDDDRRGEIPSGYPTRLLPLSLASVPA